MKTVIVLRHAKAVAGPIDHDRALAERGVADAARAGALLKAADLRIDAALVSDSRRTRETFEGVSRVLGTPPRVVFEHRLYEASLGTVLDLIRTAPETESCLLLVGHNPTFGELARHLAATGPADAMTDLRARFATGTSAVIDLPVDRWKAVATGGTLRWLLLADADDG